MVLVSSARGAALAGHRLPPFFSANLQFYFSQIALWSYNTTASPTGQIPLLRARMGKKSFRVRFFCRLAIN